MDEKIEIPDLMIYNAAFLPGNKNDVINHFENIKISFPYDVWKTKSGDYTISVSFEDKHLFLHSKYEPSKEASKILKTEVTENKQIIVIGGIGLGYFAEEALNLYPDSWVIVVEKSEEIFKLALKYRNLKSVLSNDRFKLIVGDNSDKVVEHFEDYVDIYGKKPNVSAIIHRPSKEIYPDYYRQLIDIIYSYGKTREININTVSRFGKLWSRNLLTNIEMYLHDKGVKILFDKYKNIPCVIVAGGPSLQKNVHLLKDIQDKSIIIACNTVVQPLQNLGINPDIIVAVDPQDLLVKYFQGVDCEKSLFVCEPFVSRRIPRLFKDRTLMVSSVFPVAKMVERISGEKGEIDIGGSVATAAYGLAYKMGCDPICFIGLDLSYSGTEMHIKGTYFEQAWIYNSNRLDTISQKVDNYFKKSNLIKIDAYYGGKVDSDNKFMTFIKWFENKFQNIDRNIIDCTEGGAHKNYCKKMSFKEAIDLYFIENINEENKISKLIPFRETKNSDYADELKREIKKFINKCQNIKNLAKKAIPLAKNFYKIQYNYVIHNKEKPKMVNDLIHEMDNIDEKIMKDVNASEILSMAIQRIIHIIENDMDTELTEKEKEHKELKTARRSLDLYLETLETAEFNIYFFSKTLECLE